MPSVTIAALIEMKREGWPQGACSLFHEIENYSGPCGRCGWPCEDHEYLQNETETLAQVLHNGYEEGLLRAKDILGAQHARGQSTDESTFLIDEALSQLTELIEKATQERLDERGRSR